MYILYRVLKKLGVRGYFFGMEEVGKILLKIVKGGRVWIGVKEKRVLCRGNIINKGL